MHAFDSTAVAAPNGRGYSLSITKSKYPLLELVARPTLTTGEAAHYLNREPQTLRVWASQGCGPLKPLRINGRLAWPTGEVKRLVGLGP